MPGETVQKWLVTILFVGLCAFAILYMHNRSIQLPDTVKQIKHGKFSSQTTSDFQSITLPHDWRHLPVKIDEGWYRFEFFIDDKPRELYAIYFPTLSQNTVVYLNGLELGDGGSMTEPVTRHWPRPLIFPIAPELVSQGKNELLMLLASGPIAHGFLPDFYIGPRDSLLPAFWDRFSLKVTVPNAITVVMGIYGILLMLIPWRSSSETQYLWGGAIILGFTSHAIPTIITNMTLDPIVWEIWRHYAIGFTGLFIIYFSNRYFNKRRAVQETTSTVIVLIATLISIILIAFNYRLQYFLWASPLWGSTSLILGIVAGYNFTKGIKNSPSIGNHAIMASGLLLILFGVHDILSVCGLISRKNGYLIHYASPIFAIVFSFILFVRFADSRNAVEALNKNLEKRVKLKASELENSYKQISQLEMQQVAVEERERLTREMHDGIGGYIASALALAEKHNLHDITNSLRDANDEMRTIIDTADSDNDITHALGSMREKLERRLMAARIRLEWNVQDVPDLHSQDPSVALNIVRLVQESINNAIKHSKATVVKVTLLQHSTDTALLKISDDGQCDILERPNGNGVRNIKLRARAINSTIRFIKQGELGGLTIQLTMPYKN